METLLDTLVVALRADTRALDRDFTKLRADLGGLGDAGDRSLRQLTGLSSEANVLGDTLTTAADRLGRGLEGAFTRFATTGKLSFADLRSSALRALDDIAQAAIRSGLDRIFGRGTFGTLLGNVFGGAVLSAAGRAIGGPVTAGRPVVVGERGPELVIPGSTGRVVPLGRSGGERRARPIAITINVNAGPAGRMTRESAGQIALAVRRAVERAARNA